VTLTVGSHRLQIVAENAASDAPYVQSMSIDGTASTGLWLPLQTLRRANTVRFTMGTQPNMDWGSAPADAPPSLSSERWDASGDTISARKARLAAELDAGAK
jgi:putative alpha-1,2-mannosidase